MKNGSEELKRDNRHWKAVHALSHCGIIAIINKWLYILM